jgi:hypothetical protein
LVYIREKKKLDCSSKPLDTSCLPASSGNNSKSFYPQVINLSMIPPTAAEVELQEKNILYPCSKDIIE